MQERRGRRGRRRQEEKEEGYKTGKDDGNEHIKQWERPNGKNKERK